jgi:hypothetical protein
MSDKFLSPVMSEMITSLITGLNSKTNVRKWHAGHWIAFRQLFRNIDKVGIELEYFDSKPHNMYDSQSMIGCELKHSRINNDSNIIRESEIIQLFNCTSPNNLVSTMKKFCSTLLKHKINSGGAIHMSIVGNYYNSRVVGVGYANRLSDFVGDNESLNNVYRFENKKFSGYIVSEDLMAQLILFAGSFKCETLSEYKNLLQTVIDARNVVCKDKLWAVIDLTKVCILFEDTL